MHNRSTDSQKKAMFLFRNCVRSLFKQTACINVVHCEEVAVQRFNYEGFYNTPFTGTLLTGLFPKCVNSGVAHQDAAANTVTHCLSKPNLLN